MAVFYFGFGEYFKEYLDGPSGVGRIDPILLPAGP
jgi:hypothetical protein